MFSCLENYLILRSNTYAPIIPLTSVIVLFLHLNINL